MPAIAFQILSIAKDAQCNVFVESGTHLGTSFRRALESGIFERCYTVEIVPKLYSRLAVQYPDQPNRRVFLGRSHEVFRDQVLPLCFSGDRILFWLDGHCGAKDGGGADFPCPLLDELEAIRQCCPSSSLVIAIDDTEHFGRRDTRTPGNNWPTRNEVEAAAYRINPHFFCLDYTGEGATHWLFGGVLVFSYQSSNRREQHFAPGGTPIDNSYRQLVMRAQQLAESGAHADAVGAYREAAALAPDRPDAHYDLALVHHQGGELVKAVACFEKVSMLTPEDATVWNNLGVLHYGQGEMDAAAAAFREALSRDRRYVDAWYGLAKVLVGRGCTGEAARALRACLRWEPQHDRAREVLDGLRAEAELPRVVGLRIGLVSIWFERGQAYVTKTLRDVLARHQATFVLARTGGVYGQAKLETQGFWDVPNLTVHPDYRIPPSKLTEWIRQNRLDAVVFNEEYDWDLVRAAKSAGVKVLTYLDYYKESWKPLMFLYDGVLCSTLRTFYLVRDVCEAHYVGWAVDTDLFRPREGASGEGDKFTFFHNAGWLGINYRKMTPAVIEAFDRVSHDLPGATLLVHAQAELERLPPRVVRIVHENPRITYGVETVPAPGLYHQGRILLFPTKLEGLGLPLLEGMACGLSAIATDAPPMNEFVRDGYNGLLVRVARTETRADNIAFPETIVDLNHLAHRMLELGRDEVRVKEMGSNARRYALEHLSGDRLAEKVNSVLVSLLEDGCKSVPR